MFKLGLRLLIGIFGALSLLLASRLWLSPHIAAGALGLTELSNVGLATIRADVGGIFTAIGLLMIYGALRNSRTALTGALIVVASAFAGRLFAAAQDGVGEAQIPPLAIEFVMIALLTISRMLAPKR